MLAGTNVTLSGMSCAASEAKKSSSGSYTLSLMIGTLTVALVWSRLKEKVRLIDVKSEPAIKGDRRQCVL